MHSPKEPMATKDLVELILNNPGCRAIIDNDSFALYKAYPENWADMSDAEQDTWEVNNILLGFNEQCILPVTGYYRDCYGGELLQALAVIQGVVLEEV